MVQSGSVLQIPCNIMYAYTQPKLIYNYVPKKLGIIMHNNYVCYKLALDHECHTITLCTLHILPIDCCQYIKCQKYNCICIGLEPKQCGGVCFIRLEHCRAVFMYLRLISPKCPSGGKWCGTYMYSARCHWMHTSIKQSVYLKIALKKLHDTIYL